MIPKETVDDILARNDIESLISGYVSLKRAGSNLKGLCPFHSEKSPSFTVYPADNSFYCFGCGVGGNAITFVRQIEHLDYPDAVTFLAKRAGMNIVVDDGKDAVGAPKFDKARIFAVNTEAARFFNVCLFADTPEAKAALGYFTGKRALALSTIKHFGLGFAPNSYDALGKYLKSKGFTYEEMYAANLVGKSERGSYYDAFRNRVMFPIIDVSGNVIAFGGRVMDDSKPKYKNSSDTPVFKKTRNLFALNFARLACAETMILCEGYMDVIAMHAAGFTNAVATLGTAITQDQARIMSRYTKKVIISYDADEAGQKAAVRALGMLEEVGLTVQVLKIPGAKDPDEYIRVNGANAFQKVLDGSFSKFDYNMNRLMQTYNINLPQDRINMLNELATLISAMTSQAERDVYIRIVASKMGVSIDTLTADVKTRIAKLMKQQNIKEGQLVRQQITGVLDKVNRDFAKAPAVAKNEENVLGMLLLFENHRTRTFKQGLLSVDDFFTNLGKRIFLYLKNMTENPQAPTDPNEVFTPEEVGRMTEMKISRMKLTDNGDGVFDELCSNLKSAISKKQSETISTIGDLNALIAARRNEEKQETKGQ